MKLSKFLLSLVLLAVLACGNDVNSKTEANNTEDLKTLTPQAFEKFNYTDYALSEEAEIAVSEWEKYQELAIQINYLKKGDLSFFSSERELILDFTKEFLDQLPKGLKTNPISSRVTVVVTTLLKLNDDLTLDNITLQNKQDSVKHLLVAFSNLNFQINKKLERDLFDRINPE